MNKTDIVSVARDPRTGGYECDARDARVLAARLREAGYRVSISRVAAEGRRLLTWHR